MKPAPFDYVCPDTLDGALEQLEQHGYDATLLAGGQSLVPMLAMRLARPSVLVDLNRVTELARIEATPEGLRVGAMTRQASILEDPTVATNLPAFAQITRYVGHAQTRSRGTVGGSLTLCDPAAEYPAFALAMDAEVELRTASDGRRVAMQDFIQGPYMTAIEPDEVMTAVHFPPSDGALVIIDEIYRRPGDFALAGLVAKLNLGSDGRIADARFAWLGLGSHATRSLAAEDALVGQSFAELDIDGLVQLAVDGIDAKEDVQASAAYRRSAARTLFARVMRQARETAR